MSPGCNWLCETGTPMPHSAYVECGSDTPIWAYAYMIRPLQSKPLGEAPPQTYGTPRYCIATPTTPPCVDGGATVASGVDAATPTGALAVSDEAAGADVADVADVAAAVAA